MTTGDLRLQLWQALLNHPGSAELRAFGSSMLPVIFPGDLLSVHKADFDALREGDIAVCSDGERFWIHRVASKTATHLITWGDSTLDRDPPVAAVHVIGRVNTITTPRGKTCAAPQERGDFSVWVAALCRRSRWSSALVVKVARWSGRSTALLPERD